MKKVSLYILFILVVCNEIQAQQLPYYTQYRSNIFLLNPAVTGTKRTVDARLGYRYQWAGYDGAPRTSMVSAHGRFFKGKMGAGLFMVQDRIGPSKQTNLGVNYAFHIRFPDCELSMGAGGLFTKYTLEGGDITLHNTVDPSINQYIASSVWVPDVNAGIYLYNDRFHIGVGALHLAQQKANFYKGDSAKHGKIPYSAHVNLSVGYNFAQNPEYVWESNVLATYVTGVPLFLDYTLRLHIKEKMLCGLSLRLHDAVALHLGVTFLEDFQVTYSYDFLLSKMRHTNSGSHEIVITYSMKPLRGKKHGKTDNQFVKQKYGYMF